MPSLLNGSYGCKVGAWRVSILAELVCKRWKGFSVVIKYELYLVRTPGKDCKNGKVSARG